MRAGVILISPTFKYLCVYQNCSNLWGFPKGRIKKYETLNKCASRELLEETGIYINPLDLKNYIKIKSGKHQHNYFICYVDTEIEANVDMNEIIDYKWMSLDELKILPVSVFTKQIISRIKTNKTY